MAEREQVLARFEAAADLLAAGRAARDRDLELRDAWTPCPVPGLEELLDLEPTGLPQVCLLVTLLAAAGVVAFEAWALGVSWPVDIGGKPAMPWPALVPIAASLAILAGGLTAMGLLLVQGGLAPGKAVPEDLRDPDGTAFRLQVAGDEEELRAWLDEVEPATHDHVEVAS